MSYGTSIVSEAAKLLSRFRKNKITPYNAQNELLKMIAQSESMEEFKAADGVYRQVMHASRRVR